MPREIAHNLRDVVVLSFKEPLPFLQCQPPIVSHQCPVIHSLTLVLILHGAKCTPFLSWLKQGK